MNAPLVTTLAMALPDTDPIAAEARTAAFAGPSPLSSGDRVRQVDEELSCARNLQQRSEQDEDEDEGGGHTQGDPVYPLLAKIKLSHEPFGAVASMPKHAGGARNPHIRSR